MNTHFLHGFSHEDLLKQFPSGIWVKTDYGYHLEGETYGDKFSYDAFLCPMCPRWYIKIL